MYESHCCRLTSRHLVRLTYQACLLHPSLPSSHRRNCARRWSSRSPWLEQKFMIATNPERNRLGVLVHFRLMLWDFISTTCFTRVVARVESLEVGVASVSAATGCKVNILNGLIWFFPLSRSYIFGTNERKFSKWLWFYFNFMLSVRDGHCDVL